jgi:hypothetical protein
MEHQLTPEQASEILSRLDLERQTIVYPWADRVVEDGVVRDTYADDKNCDIVYSCSTEKDVDRVIRNQVDFAKSRQYDLEWKLYGHDKPACLAERLTAAGFEAGDKEAFMVVRANHESLERFGNGGGEIRRMSSRDPAMDYQAILEEVRGKSCSEEVEAPWTFLERYPDNMSLYLAYVDGEPAATGRVYFHKDSRFAYLYGGNTRERFRNRGLFTQVVAARIREAISRGVEYVCVDALPTSEPILRKHGFEAVTYTQPFLLSPSCSGPAHDLCEKAVTGTRDASVIEQAERLCYPVHSKGRIRLSEFQRTGALRQANTLAW